MVTISTENFFAWHDKPLYICLVDKRGCLSGEVMKQVDFRSPQATTVLRAKLHDKPANLGSCYFTGLESAPYLFIVARESYRHKYDEKTIRTILQAILPQLVSKGYTQLRFCAKDYPLWFEDVLKACDVPNANIILTAKCGWRE